MARLCLTGSGDWPRIVSVFEPDYQAVFPSRGRSFSAELSEGLDLLLARVDGKRDRILAVTFFAATDGSRDFGLKKRTAAGLLSRTGIRAPWSFVAQPPAPPSRVSLYAETIPSGARAFLRRRHWGGFPYSVIESGPDRMLFAAGLTGGLRPRDMAGRSRAALEAAGRILAREGLSAGDIVRQWNYLEGIIAVRASRTGPCQNYQEFNDSRRDFYSRSAFAAGYPAATGIGARDGGVIVDFRALAPRRGLRIVPLSNPLQKDAHRYSRHVLVGGDGADGPAKSAPLFERAKFVGDGTSGLVYISGTAAIRDQSTAGAGDTAAQTRITIENIRRLVSAANLRRHGVAVRGETGPPAYLRAYVRRGRDLGAVRAACRRAFGDIPSHFVRADICRDDLLVEIEGIVRVKLEKTRGKEGASR